MLAMGRALMSRARLLLLDEPSMGLAPLLVREIFRVIQRINRQGTAILLVEQNAHLALEVAPPGLYPGNGRDRPERPGEGTAPPSPGPGGLSGRQLKTVGATRWVAPLLIKIAAPYDD